MRRPGHPVRPADTRGRSWVVVVVSVGPARAGRPGRSEPATVRDAPRLASCFSIPIWKGKCLSTVSCSQEIKAVWSDRIGQVERAGFLPPGCPRALVVHQPLQSQQPLRPHRVPTAPLPLEAPVDDHFPPASAAASNERMPPKAGGRRRGLIPESPFPSPRRCGSVLRVSTGHRPRR